MAGRRAGVLAVCLALALGGIAAAGCGGDDEGGDSEEESTIEPQTPEGPTGAAGEAGAEEGQPADDDSDVGLEDGTVTPPPESDSQTEGAEDSPGNDVAPEPGSPQDQFEDFCDQNPEACS
jgi:hypothetical protein